VGLQGAHTIMRYAAQLDGTPAAELLAQLPPLPPGAVELPFGGHGTGAMDQVVSLMFQWPYAMRKRAPPGQDFLLQLPGGLGELRSLMVHTWVVACDAEAHVAAAMVAKERGNTAFAAGDIHCALSAYRTGIDSLRTLTAMHLQHNAQAMLQQSQRSVLPASSPEYPAATLSIMRHLLAPLIYTELFPYDGGQYYPGVIRETATLLFREHPPLPPMDRLPGCKDLPSLIGTFWSQLIPKFMEPFGGMDGLLVHEGAWKHHTPNVHVTTRFHPLVDAPGHSPA
jgi:hypothetical protein